MGFLDSFLGSEPKVKYKQSPQQAQLGNTITPYLQNLFQPNAWQNLLPTTEMMQSLSPEIWGGANYSINQGANQLTENLMGSGIMGGSAGSALAQYYANAQPQVYGQLANSISSAASYPYSMAASLYGQTLPNPVVSGGNPGLLGSIFQMAAPWAMSYMPWGNFGGGGGGGGASTIGGQFAKF